METAGTFCEPNTEWELFSKGSVCRLFAPSEGLRGFKGPGVHGSGFSVLTRRALQVLHCKKLSSAFKKNIQPFQLEFPVLNFNFNQFEKTAVLAF